MLKEMQNHAKYTHEIIDKCFSYRIVNIASHHHEKLDGTGYPEHLTARNLTIGDKVIAVADIASAFQGTFLHRRQLHGTVEEVS